jgi:uncharacterized protein (TIGR00251 family)
LASLEGRREREPAEPAEAADSRTRVTESPLACVRQSGADTLLLVHARPGAKVAALLGTHAGRLKISIDAPPVDGKANETLLDFLAALLKRPRRQLHLHSGTVSRFKSVRIEAAQAAQIARDLVTHMANAKQNKKGQA